MSNLRSSPKRSAACCLTLSLLAAFSFASAEEPAQGPARNQPDDSSNANSLSDANGPQSQSQTPETSQNPPAGPANNPSYDTVPAKLTIKTGTFLTVRINQWLSSDRNQTGDAFSASLARPLVVDGMIVAQRGQTLGGRVVEAKKAGRVEGVSRLAIELTELTLADGQQVPIQSQMITRTGPTSVGRDASAIAGTTTLGAAVGAAAGRGVGAAIGAGAGAAAGMLGVLLTRGRPTLIYPESLLTFRIQAPVTVTTARAPQAFRYVEPNDYDRSYETRGPTPPSLCPGYDCPPPPPPYYYGYYWPHYYPYYYAPGFTVFYGSRFFYGRRFYGGRVGFRH
jgi:hypothetical protein